MRGPSARCNTTAMSVRGARDKSRCDADAAFLVLPRLDVLVPCDERFFHPANTRKTGRAGDALKLRPRSGHVQLLEVEPRNSYADSANRCRRSRTRVGEHSTQIDLRDPQLGGEVGDIEFRSDSIAFYNRLRPLEQHGFTPAQTLRLDHGHGRNAREEETTDCSLQMRESCAAGVNGRARKGGIDCCKEHSHIWVLLPGDRSTVRNKAERMPESYLHSSGCRFRGQAERDIIRQERRGSWSESRDSSRLRQSDMRIPFYLNQHGEPAPVYGLAMDRSSAMPYPRNAESPATRAVSENSERGRTLRLLPTPSEPIIASIILHHLPALQKSGCINSSATETHRDMDPSGVTRPGLRARRDDGEILMQALLFTPPTEPKITLSSLQCLPINRPSGGRRRGRCRPNGSTSSGCRAGHRSPSAALDRCAAATQQV